MAERIAEAACLTLPDCALRADAATWGEDPCPEMLKWAYVEASCVQPMHGAREGDVFSLKVRAIIIVPIYGESA
jgi:hypothetical protein